MAKRRYRQYTGRPRYYKAKRFYGKRKGLLGSSTVKHIATGGIAGVATSFIPKFLGKWTNPAVLGAGGFLLNKPDLFTLAGYEAAKAFMGNGIGATNGGIYEG